MEPWIAAILNLTFPGIGYLFIGKKLLGSFLLLPTIAFNIYYNFLLAVEKRTEDWSNYVFAIISIGLAIHVYRQAKMKYILPEKKKRFTLNTFYRRTFIGIYSFFLIVGIILLITNIQQYFGFSTSEPNSTIKIIKPAEYKLTDFILSNLACFSLLIIPFLSRYLQLKKVPIKKISFSFLSIIIFFSSMIVWSSMLDSRDAHTKPTNEVLKDEFTGKELMAAFNKERVNNHAEPLKENAYVCKMAEIRLHDALTIGVKTFNNTAGLLRAYDVVNDLSYEAKVTKENHVPDNAMELFTYQANVEDAITVWTKDINIGYAFNDSNYTFGCATVKDGYGVVILGGDDKPFEMKLDDHATSISI